jgi:hypothetical protein
MEHAPGCDCLMSARTRDKPRDARWRALVVAAAFAALVGGCNEPYRIGEFVWVEWEGRDYPAYIIEQRGKARFRVHFDGYDARWDDDVTVDRIKGRIEGPVKHPPPPERVAREMGIRPKPASSAEATSPYKVSDRVRVRWRGSVYSATIQGVLAPDRFLIHYDGYGSAWDETIAIDRIVGRRP